TPFPPTSTASRTTVPTCWSRAPNRKQGNRRHFSDLLGTGHVRPWHGYGVRGHRAWESRRGRASALTAQHVNTQRGSSHHGGLRGRLERRRRPQNLFG